MKTVIGAINKFKGGIKSGTLLVISDGRADGYYESCLECIVNDFYKLVCTRDQFNAQVDHLASNMGRATQSYAEYKKEFEYMTTPTIQPNPVFTQAMADNGDNPSAGMAVMASLGEGAWFKFRVDYIGSIYIIGHRSDKDREAAFGIDGIIFKPLTPPTTLVDGKAYQFDFGSNPEISTGKGLVGICHTSIKHGTRHVMFESPIKASKWNSEHCTNIQQLTVEVK